jgi:cold shock protein
MSTATALVGTVKWFHSGKGYGFITTDDSAQFFVHYTGIAGDGYKSLNEGDQVNFDVEKSAKGLKAINVTVLAKK